MNPLWLLLGELALVGTVFGGVAVYVVRRRRFLLIDSLSGLAENLRKGEMQRARKLRDFLERRCGADSGRAEATAIRLMEKEREFVHTLAQILLTDITALSRLQEPLQTLLDERTETVVGIVSVALDLKEAPVYDPEPETETRPEAEPAPILDERPQPLILDDDFDVDPGESETIPKPAYLVEMEEEDTEEPASVEPPREPAPSREDEKRSALDEIDMEIWGDLLGLQEPAPLGGGSKGKASNGGPADLPAHDALPTLEELDALRSSELPSLEELDALQSGAIPDDFDLTPAPEPEPESGPESEDTPEDAAAEDPKKSGGAQSDIDDLFSQYSP